MENVMGNFERDFCLWGWGEKRGGGGGGCHIFQGKKIQYRLPVKPRQLWHYLMEPFVYKYKALLAAAFANWTRLLPFLLSSFHGFSIVSPLTSICFNSSLNTPFSLLASTSKETHLKLFEFGKRKKASLCINQK